MTECPQKKANLDSCNCTYSCSKKGKCCECLAYHRNAGEFPACFFSAKAERTYDRSFSALKKDRGG
ncbi:MAG: hypothetical protein HY815_33295 [Candidatus Riflebacteria bacterium]|nr:hypothetical protein [Candidatus Riflebacteria bacterium]